MLYQGSLLLSLRLEKRIATSMIKLQERSSCYRMKNTAVVVLNGLNGSRLRVAQLLRLDGRSFLRPPLVRITCSPSLKG